MRLQRLRHPVFSIRRARVLPRWIRRIDSRAQRRLNVAHGHQVVDIALRRLSRSADRGRLWFAIALALAATGRGRAATRGVLSLTAASIVANLVGKKLLGGPRPLLKDVPVGRRLAKYPTSASFPSGHSASAAAFATGVALESGRAGAVLAPLAGAVVYSRLHVGAHWLSDVVGGSVLGAGVALLGRLFVPARPPQHQPTPGTGVPIELPASTDGHGVLIVMNASAGNDTLHSDPRPVLEKALPAADIRILGKDDTFESVVDDAMAGDNPPDVIGVCGGDGSVSRMAHLARRHDRPFLALPGGTFNHFARSAGLSSLDVGLAALRQGSGLLVAVADLELPTDEDRRSGGEERAGKTVLNAAAVGIYPDFVAARKVRKKTLGKWIGGVVAAAEMARTARPVRLTVDGRDMEVWSLFVSVGRNDPAQIATMQRRTLDDDVLDVRILPATVHRVRAVASLAFGRTTARALRVVGLLPPRHRTLSFLAKDLDLVVHPSGDRPAGITHDGELEQPGTAAEDYRSRLVLRPRALRVYAPHHPRHEVARGHHDRTASGSDGTRA